MPSRYLKESLLASRKLNEVSAQAERLYVRLLVVVDDFGRYVADPTVLASKAYPRRRGADVDTEVAGCLSELSGAGLIEVYVADGESHLEIVNFCVHNPPRARESKFPGPEKAERFPVLASAGSREQAPADAGSRAQTQANVPYSLSSSLSSSTSTAPTADAAVPAPAGAPEQQPLIDTPTDTPAKRKPRTLTVEQQQADAWRAKALGVAGIALADAGPWPKGIFHQWRREAKARGVETLMRALDGIARMPPTEFARKRGWVHWISGEGIDAGLAALAAPNAPAASRGASNAISGGGSVREWREYDRPPPEPGPDWTPEAALAKLIHRPAFMAHEPPGRFVVPKGKSLGDFDTSRIPPQHLPILDLNVEGL